MNTAKVFEAILREFSLQKFGVHGVAHWARVLENGRELARRSPAKIHVVELFALLHDSKRRTEGADSDHGWRAAEYARSLRGTVIDLTDDDFFLLFKACAYHSHGLNDADITVQTCWDADRLDLGRTGTTPSPERLCSTEAKEDVLIALVDERSRNRCIPRLVISEWSLPSLLDQANARKFEEVPEILFHGSATRNIKFLQPRRNSYPGNEPDAPPAVYAARNPAIAVAHVYKEPKRLGCNPVDQRCQLELLESGQEALGGKASVYLVGGKSFGYLPSLFEIYRSVRPVDVLGEIAYPDIRTAIEELGGVVKILAQWPDGCNPS